MKHVPTIAAPIMREAGYEYRLRDDPEFAIRIVQSAPNGLPRKVAEFVPVAGISQPDAAHHAEAFVNGSSRRLELRRVPDNPINPNAIEVWGHWIEDTTEQLGRLGYLPTELAAQLVRAEEPQIGATLSVMYAASFGRNVGLRLDIWAPRKTNSRPVKQPNQKLKIPADSVDRNLLGMELEREGKIDNAIECYERNVREGFEGNHPYDRLATIYQRRKDSASEIAILKRAVEVFEKLVQTSPRVDVAPKLEKFRQRLAKALGSQTP